MAKARRVTSLETQEVVIIGHNPRVIATVIILVGGGITVRVFTSDPAVEEQLAPYPGTLVTIVAPGYQTPPADLPREGPYFICVDRKDLAFRIRDWLPRTVAIFHLTNERRGRLPARGFLTFGHTLPQTRGRLLRQIGLLKRVDRLLEMGRHSSTPLILLYGDPDPDAIGSALGLAALWRSAGVEPAIRYTGEVQRYQNRLLLNYLKEPIERLREGELQRSDLVAVVDAQPGFWVKALPAARVVIDHHPRLPDTAAEFMDIRESCGSTSSILTEYFLAANLSIPRPLATALLYGLITDTANLQRGTHPVDIRAFDRLHGRADRGFLSRLYHSRISPGMLDRIARGILQRLVHRDIAMIHFGEIDNPDLLVQAADLVMFTCGIYWVVCAGKLAQELVVVLRGDGHRQDVGARAKAAFGRLGSAGGHRTMGRAQVCLDGQDVEASVDILVNNLFRRMGERRRCEFIGFLRDRLRDTGAVPREGASRVGGSAPDSAVLLRPSRHPTLPGPIPKAPSIPKEGAS